MVGVRALSPGRDPEDRPGPGAQGAGPYQEFNTWYVRGLCRRLMEEGETPLQVYRAGDGDAPGDECTAYENMVLEIRFLYNGHRAKYWPRPNPQAFSVPCGPRCRHSVRRISAGHEGDAGA